MDQSDTATVREEQARAAALANRRPTGPEPTGMCHNCEAPVAEGLRWCDVECRDEWAHYTRTAL